MPPPEDFSDLPLQLRATTIEWSEFVGSIVVGRITAGILNEGQQVTVLKAERVRQRRGPSPASNCSTSSAADRSPQARSGDIVAVQGLDEPAIGDTIADPAAPRPAATAGRR